MDVFLRLLVFVISSSPYVTCTALSQWQHQDSLELPPLLERAASFSQGRAFLQGKLRLPDTDFQAPNRTQEENTRKKLREAEAEEHLWKERRKELRKVLYEARDLIYNRGYPVLPTWSRWALQVTISWVINMLLCLIIWMNYYPEQSDPEDLFGDKEQLDPVKTFTDSRFGCLESPKICFWACLCPALRWADNLNMVGFRRFPVALGLFFLCALANGLTGTFCYFGTITAFIILYYRHKLRAKLDLPSWTVSTCCADFFYVFLCSWCAIAQEARVVRGAYQQGVLSLTTGKRYDKSDLPGRPFPRVAGHQDSAGASRILPPPPEPAPLAAQRLVTECGLS